MKEIRLPSNPPPPHPHQMSCLLCSLPLRPPLLSLSSSPSLYTGVSHPLHPSLPLCRLCCEEAEAVEEECFEEREEEGEEEEPACGICAEDTHDLILCDACPRSHCTLCMDKYYDVSTYPRLEALLNEEQRGTVDFKCWGCEPESCEFSKGGRGGGGREGRRRETEGDGGRRRETEGDGGEGDFQTCAQTSLRRTLAPHLSSLPPTSTSSLTACPHTTASATSPSPPSSIPGPGPSSIPSSIPSVASSDSDGDLPTTVISPPSSPRSSPVN